MGAMTETLATRMTGSEVGMEITQELPSLTHCLPVQTYPHAFLLGLLQKKFILTNQWLVQRVCRERATAVGFLQGPFQSLCTAKNHTEIQVREDAQTPMASNHI